MALGSTFTDINDYSDMVGLVLVNTDPQHRVELVRIIKGIDETTESWVDSIFMKGGDVIAVLSEIALKDPPAFCWALSHLAV